MFAFEVYIKRILRNAFKMKEETAEEPDLQSLASRTAHNHGDGMLIR